MNRTFPLSLAAATLFAASVALAQGSGSPAPGGGASPGSPSGAPGGQAQGTQQQVPGTMRTDRFDPTNAPGWSQMNETERSEMMRRMESIRSYDECRAYMTQHGDRMRSRGATSGATTGSSMGSSTGATTGATTGSTTGAAAADPCAHMQRG
jgi:hypothetical protein